MPWFRSCRDMLKHTRFLHFRYTKAYHKMASDEFLIDFFNDPNVQKALEVRKKVCLCAVVRVPAGVGEVCDWW
jgi:hypothetical protein